MSNQSNFIKPFIAGSAAGLVTDVVLFPIDTIKTRLQSADGFRKAGSFNGIYRGLGSAITGSMPQAAAFFLFYETSKTMLRPSFSSDTLLHLSSTCVGESASCLVRMPFEVVKQRAQATKSANSRTALLETLKSDGIFGLYKGLLSMMMRDLPFMIIQMPLWEFLKKKVTNKTGEEIKGYQSGFCGSIAGGVAAILTCPLDVIKTRIVLSQNSSTGILNLFFVIVKEEGIKSLFSGLVPRVTLITIGGFVFLGMYDQTRLLLNQFID